MTPCRLNLQISFANTIAFQLIAIPFRYLKHLANSWTSFSLHLEQKAALASLTDQGAESVQNLADNYLSQGIRLKRLTPAGAASVALATHRRLPIVDYEDSDDEQIQSSNPERQAQCQSVDDDLDFVCPPALALDDVMSCLIRLRISLERLQTANLFPYNVQPLVMRLERIEALYEADDENRMQD